MIKVRLHTVNGEPTSANEHIQDGVSLNDALHYRVRLDVYEYSSGFMACNSKKSHEPETALALAGRRYNTVGFMISKFVVWLVLKDINKV